MPSLFSLEGLALGAYVACLLFLLLFSLGQLHLLVMHRRRRPSGKPRPGPERASEWLPLVTVQLPVYNERYVIRRLLAAVAALDYPRDRLEIQVLDDSADDTVQLAAETIAALQRQGVPVTHVRRGARTGFKAGALAHGLALAGGEFVAVFDADFLPDPDFLRRTLPSFADPGVAAVQTRWEHLNRHESTLTRLQAFMLNVHFHLEQPVRHRHGLFLNFNGTAGVWRVAAVVDAGGWSAETLTEDIDLSYRAQLRGWRLVYLDDYGCPGELPADMNGFRGQQYRWTKGGAENARKHLAGVLGSGLPRRVRLHGVQHLVAGSAYLAILGALLASVPLAALKNTAIALDYTDWGLPFVSATLALFAVFHGAQSPAPVGPLGHLRFVGSMLVFLVFSMGLSVHNGGAALSGWLGRRSPFVRTPKAGDDVATASVYAARRLDRRLVREVLVLTALLVGLVVGWRRRQFALFPIQVMASAGIVWVVGLSLVHARRARRRTRRAATGSHPDPATAVTATQEAAV
jgi:cellulose synthase/poly-beta-1,6-N-acetylglucosamine synthase-like glycosyltransferase